MIDSLSSSVSTKHIPVSEGSTFRWLKQCARTIAKKAREKRNAKDVTLKSEIVDSHNERDNFIITIKRSHEVPSSTVSPSIQPGEKLVITEAPKVSQPGQVNDSSKEATGTRPTSSEANERVITGTQSSIVQLCTAFRDTVYSELSPACASTHCSPRQSQASVSPPMSPSFLHPRQAPRPPLCKAGDCDTVVSSLDVRLPCTTEVALGKPTQPTYHNDTSVDTVGGTINSSPSNLSGIVGFPSTGSGLELIGAALLGYPQPSHENYDLNASCSSLDAQAVNDRSFSLLLETMEYCTLVRRSSKRTSCKSATTFSIPSCRSVPENLVDSCSSLDDLLKRTSYSSTRSPSSRPAIFFELISGAVQSQDSGPEVPPPRNMIELWSALSARVTKESLASLRAREMLQSISECDVENKTISASQSCPSPLLESQRRDASDLMMQNMPFLFRGGYDPSEQRRSGLAVSSSIGIAI
ncbi:hypothetical protein M408DRAFT_94100 [Serendipita vermifera MAFF 305830]|uniref:Uncharacterized protein n=1 Tax=Serendipita vermifera MAFF 305830 TaxID=933852 RepID=A0A0C3BSF3_SERVB|nr:hypothetical protein M408DRAFT_94100 [Serendipita vermifera MAFF 305830]